MLNIGTTTRTYAMPNLKPGETEDSMLYDQPIKQNIYGTRQCRTVNPILRRAFTTKLMDNKFH